MNILGEIERAIMTLDLSHDIAPRKHRAETMNVLYSQHKDDQGLCKYLSHVLAKSAMILKKKAVHIMSHRLLVIYGNSPVFRGYCCPFYAITRRHVHIRPPYPA